MSYSHKHRHGKHGKRHHRHKHKRSHSHRHRHGSRKRRRRPTQNLFSNQHVDMTYSTNPRIYDTPQNAFPAFNMTLMDSKIQGLMASQRRGDDERYVPQNNYSNTNFKADLKQIVNESVAQNIARPLREFEFNHGII